MGAIRDKLNKISKNERLFSLDELYGKYRVSDFVREIYFYINDSSQVYNDWRKLKYGIKYDTIEYIYLKKEDLFGLEGWWIACNHNLVITDFQAQVWEDFDLLYPETVEVWERILTKFN